MYTNPANIIKSMINILDRNQVQINRVVREWEDNRKLNVFEGMRKTLPVDAFPSFEIEPTNASNSWGTTRTQRPRYNFQCTLTIKCSNEEFGVDYLASLATVIVEIMTDPTILQFRVVNETRWTPFGGLCDTRVLDSLVEDVTYSAAKDGSFRVAEFSWFALIHEPFPDSKFKHGDPRNPVVIRPKVIEVA